MIWVPQTTECPDKTPQIHYLCSVLFDPATDHVINNENNRNTQSEFHETISPRHKISGLLKNGIHKSSRLIDNSFKWHSSSVAIKSWQNRYLYL